MYFNLLVSWYVLWTLIRVQSLKIHGVIPFEKSEKIMLSWMRHLVAIIDFLSISRIWIQLLPLQLLKPNCWDIFHSLIFARDSYALEMHYIVFCSFIWCKVSYMRDILTCDFIKSAFICINLKYFLFTIPV